MTKLLLTLARIFIWSSLSLLMIFVIAISLGKELLLDVNDFRVDIEQFVSKKTALQVRVGALHGAWRGLRPELIVSELDVRKQQDFPALFTAQTIRLQWLVLSSIFNLEPRIKMWVDDATLELVYQDGYLLPAGIGPPTLAPGGDAAKAVDTDANFRLIDFINRQPHLELSNSQLSIEGMWPQKATFNQVNVLMANRSGYREVDSRFSLSGPSESTVQMFARVKGALANLKTLQGEYYLKVDNAPIVPWLPNGLRAFEHLQLESAFGAVELWARVKRGIVHRVTANVELEDVAVRNTKEKRLSNLQVARGMLQYRHVGQGQAQVVLSDFHMKHEHFAWNPGLLSLNIEYSRSKHSNQVEWDFDLLLDEINIAPWVQYYIDFTDTESPGHRLLTKASPKGVLKHVHLGAGLINGEFGGFQASAALSNFEMGPYEFIPGVKNVSADFELNERQSFISLYSDAFLLDYPALFRSELQFDWLEAELKIEKTDDGIALETGLIALNNAEARTATQLSMLFPHDPSVSPSIRTLSTLRGVDASLTSKYLPAGILPEGLVTFLDRSVKQGQLLRGDILFNGPLLWDMQEEDLNMQLGFMVDDAEFQFLPDWDPVTHAKADVIVDRVFVDAYAIGGSYFNAPIEQVLVTTRRDDEEDPFQLSVNALVGGEASHGLDVLQHSPLRPRLGEFVDTIELQGGMALDLDLSLLLSDKNIDLRLDLGVGINDGVFSMPAQNLHVNDINGDFTFDLIRGMQADGVTGSVFGGEVRANIFPVFLSTGSKPEEGGEESILQSTQISMEGMADLSLVQGWLQSPALGCLSGELAYKSILTLPMKKSSRPNIEVWSTLKGVSVQLPEPFKKPSADERDFYVSSSLGGDRNIFSLQYGDLIELVSEVESSQSTKRLTKASVVFGGNKVAASSVELPQQDGYRIGGFLPELNVEAWRDTLYGAADSETGTLKDVSTRFPMLIDKTLLDSNLKIQDVNVFGQRFSETHFHFKPARDTWDIGVSGQGVSADFSLPKYLLKPDLNLHDQTAPIVASFSQLHIERTEEAVRGSAEETGKEDNTQGALLATLDPMLLPPLQLKIERLLLNDEVFGRWDIQLKPVSDGVLIEPLSASLKAAEFSGNGSWLIDKQGRSKTAVVGFANTDNVAEVIAAWGKEPSLDSEKASVSITAEWPGAPFEFSLLNADATMSLEIEDGHFLNVNSSAADKFWGALNFQTILKRLQLNFSDLSSDELTFEEIDGDLRLQDQVLTVEKMKVDSPAVDITLNGDVMLAEETLAMTLDVAIPVTRNLVLPAAAVGGLPAAATAYVIEKVLGKQLDKLTTIKYDVSGTFDNPEVKVKDSFSVIPKPLRESILKTDGVSKSTTENKQKERDESFELDDITEDDIAQDAGVE